MYNELYHYGVKGMKWGVRRYQPYPSGKQGRYLGKENIKERALKRYSSPTKQKIKNDIKYAMSTVASMTIPGFSLLYNANAIRHNVQTARIMMDKTDYTKKEGPPEKLSDLKKKTSKTDVKDDLKKCNPRLGNQKGATRNCLNCVAAMEMRARGYDVRARKRAYGASEFIYGDWFNGVKLYKSTLSPKEGEKRKQYVNRSYESLCSQIKKNGEGSRGCVNFSYDKAFGGGHTMYWKVENGDVNFYDGQVKKSKEQTDITFSMADPSSYTYARLDNLKVNEKITEAVISRGKKKR